MKTWSSLCFALGYYAKNSCEAGKPRLAHPSFVIRRRLSAQAGIQFVLWWESSFRLLQHTTLCGGGVRGRSAPVPPRRPQESGPTHCAP
jgi:hypothetical protein